MSKPTCAAYCHEVAIPKWLRVAVSSNGCDEAALLVRNITAILRPASSAFDKSARDGGCLIVMSDRSVYAVTASYEDVCQALITTFK